MKTTMKKKLLATLIVTSMGLTSMGLTNMAYANPYDHNGYGQGKHARMKHKSPEQRLEKMTRLLGLSATQQQQVRSLMANKKSAVQPLREQMRSLKRSLHTLNPIAPDYFSQLNSLADQKASLARQMTLAKGQHRQQLFLLLTPEQQAKLQDAQAKRMQKRMERRGQ